MKFILRFLLVFLPLVCPAAADRPRVGLVLGGGGSKGGAHIGVLRALEEMNVPVDYIAGTSAGAIVGALYASGFTPDEIEALIVPIDWQDILDDSPPRKDAPFRRKQDDLSYLVKARPGLNDGTLNLPLGIIDGQKVTQFLRRYLTVKNSDQDFDKLPIPLRIVAADLDTGAEVVLSEGDLALAVRASMSIPVLFSPVTIDGKRLIDGGAANNLPVSVVREMGADVVIAVDITTPLLSGDGMASFIDITDQMTRLLTVRTTAAQIESLTDRDLLIRPALGNIDGMDFSVTLDSVAPGVEAAFAHREWFSMLAIGDRAFDEHLAGRRAPLQIPLTVASVRINNFSNLSTRLVRHRLGVRAGDVLDRARVEAGIAELYGLELFDQIDYRLVPTSDPRRTDLVVDLLADESGPNYLQFGLALSEDFAEGSDFNLGIAYLQTAINPLGGESRVQLDLGERQGISANWFQPLTYRIQSFIDASAVVQRRDFRFFDAQLPEDPVDSLPDLDTAIARLRVEGIGADLAIGTEFGVSSELRLGWRRFEGDADVVIGRLDELDGDEIELGEYYLSYVFDLLDNVNFPRDGARVFGAASWSTPAAGGSRSFEQLSGAALGAFSLGHWTVLGRMEGGVTRDEDASLHSQFLLGGLGRLSGYPHNRFVGQNYGLASVTGFRRISPKLWLPLYTGLSLEAGNVWDDRSDVSFDSLRVSTSVYFGADTPIGPLYFALGFARGGDSAIYLTLGNPFLSDGSRPLD